MSHNQMGQFQWSSQIHAKRAEGTEHLFICKIDGTGFIEIKPYDAERAISARQGERKEGRLFVGGHGVGG